MNLLLGETMIQSKILFATVTILLFFASAFVWRHLDQGNDARILKEIESLYRERESIDSNLRGQIVGLQKKMVNLPKIFSKNKRGVLIEMIQADFAVEASEKITDREVINKLFSREERKDLFAGRIVVQTVNNQLFFSLGIIDESGDYSGAVQRNLLQTKNLRADFEKLQAITNADISEDTGKVNYQEKIALLKQICIDAAFDAEKTRIEFVSNERDVAKINNTLIAAIEDLKQDRQQTIFLILGGNLFAAIILASVLFRPKSGK